MPSGKQHWQIDTDTLAKSIRAKTRSCKTEEDVKMATEPLLRGAFEEAGIDVDIVRYETRTAITKKRMDALYGYLIIEYKAPGKLRSPSGVRAAQEQISTYLSEEASRHSDREDFLEKAVGVAIDGERILFARFSKSGRVLGTPVPVEDAQLGLLPGEVSEVGFQYQGPFPIQATTLASLIIYVRSAARRPLTAEDLADVFGPECEVTRLAVSEFYSAIMRGQRSSKLPRVAAFYEEWDRIFGVVYGEKLEKAEDAAEATAKLYHLPSGIRLKPLLFAIHTFYAFLMKLIAVELLALQRDFSVASFVEGLAAEDNSTVRERLQYLEEGAEFSQRGIDNFLEADFFSWYLDAWTGRMATVVRGVIRALADFEPATPVLAPDWTRDLLQQLYELVVPRDLRHGLGEYYTPNWLAGYLIDKSGYKGDLDARFLDPACGSGTFLVEALRRAIRGVSHADAASLRKASRQILENVVGFDLNPLAVLAARTNYLIAFAPLLQHVRPISLPVYLCDSVLPPEPEHGSETPLFKPDTVVFATHEGNYVFPTSMKQKRHIDTFTAEVMISLRNKSAPDAFRDSLARKLGLNKKEAEHVKEAYRKIKQLDDEGRDGIWAHYIKNAFAPAYMGEFDFVVGNPPWIRWGYLSDEYRKRTLPLWHKYGLFSLKGHQTRLGAGEKDFSMLFTYACADRYLKKGGTLGFVITQEVFKSKGAGEGFRRLQLGEDGEHLCVTHMEDMVHLKPFHAANKTAIFTMKKGRKTRYPVSVTEWTRKRGIGRIPPDWPLEQVRKATTRKRLKAIPVDEDSPVSSWQTATAAMLKASKRLKGANPYKAHLGARAEPYGVFWLRFKELRPDGLIVVENQHDRGKRKIPHVENAIEPDLVYAAVSGGDIQRFGIKNSFPVLISQDPAKRIPYSEDWMTEHAPHTLAYLNQFRDILLSRGSNIVRELAERTEFYAMYGIGEYTVARYRVAWKRMASRMSAVVLSTVETPFGRKKVISTDTTSFFVAKTQAEAHYLCAIMNSELVNEHIGSFSSAGRGFGAPSVMKGLAIPEYDRYNELHKRLSLLSKKAHQRVVGDEDVDDIEADINKAVPRLWNIKN
jgi:SAM-dependent methyltransferase